MALLFAMATLILLPGCDTVAPALMTSAMFVGKAFTLGRVKTVKIVDESGQPIANARTQTNYTYIGFGPSNAEGKLTIFLDQTDLDPNGKRVVIRDTPVYIEANGYQSLSLPSPLVGNAIVLQKSNHKQAALDIGAPRNELFAIRVVNSAQKPIAGAKAAWVPFYYYLPAGGERPANPPELGPDENLLSGDDGTIRMRIGSGNFRIKFSAPDYVPTIVTPPFIGETVVLESELEASAVKPNPPPVQTRR
jgi:hypothetical protein